MIARWCLVAGACLTCIARAASQDMPPALVPMAAATRVLVGIFPDWPPLGSLRVVSRETAEAENGAAVFVWVRGTKCTFQKRLFSPQFAGDASREVRPGAKIGEGRVHQIDFSKLTGLRSAGQFMALEGKPSDCLSILTAEEAELAKKGGPAAKIELRLCHDRTKPAGMQPELAEKVVRSIQYIHSHLCDPLELPPY